MKDLSNQLIVIGASAGGLETVTKILSPLPKAYPIPVVLVQHRSKENPTLLEEVLQTKLELVVSQIEEKTPILPNHLHVAPADYHVLIEKDRTFSLSSDEKVAYSRPAVDVLFESAALVYKELLTSIILSGANNDGSNGVKSTKSMGGINIALNPDHTPFNVMPQCAIDTKCIDHILSLDEITHFLLIKGGLL
jgi:two-component system chemotaxis response regulator CheB